MYVRNLLLYDMCERCMVQSSYSVHEGIIASLLHPCTVEQRQEPEGSDILSQSVKG